MGDGKFGTNGLDTHELAAECRKEVKRPGKFEGQPAWVPYFWELGIAGDADSDDGVHFAFDVTDQDREHFPELRDAVSVIVSEDDYGFVLGENY